MDEYKLLWKNGYKYDPMVGAITDSNGTYQASVVIDGQTIESAITEEEHNFNLSNEATLKETGFKFDETSIYTESQQKEQAIGKSQLKEFEESSNTSVQPNFEDPNIRKAFEESNLEKEEAGEPIYPSPEAMIQGEEEGTIFEDMPNIEDKNRYKLLLKEREELLKNDKDWKTSIEETSEEIDVVGDTVATLTPIAGIGLDLISSIAQISAKFFPSGKGMDNKQSEVRVNAIDEQVRDIELPIAAEKLRKTKILQELIQQEYDNTSKLNPQESNRYESALRKMQKNADYLQDFIEQDVFDENIFTVSNIADQATFGITGLLGDTSAELMLKLDINSGEELSPGQEALARAFAQEIDINKGQFKQTFLHELSTGLNQSIGFLRGGKLGRSLGKSVLKSLAGKGGKALSAGINVGLQAIAHPNTYKATTEQYSGPIRIEDGKITTDLHTYNTLKEETGLEMDYINSKLDYTDDPIEKAKILQQKEELQKYINNIEKNKPASGGKAYLYGLTESGKEAFSETYFGPLMGKMGKGISKSRPGRFLSKSKGANWLNSTTSPLRDTFNKKFGSTVLPGQKLIGSNLEEWGEEVFVQIIPTVGTDWQGYKDQVSELFTKDFHAKVVAQTLVMNKGAQTLGWASENKDAFNFSKKKRKSYKEKKEERAKLNKIVKNIGNTNLSEEEFKKAFMKTGEGNFSMQDYNNTITKLRASGNMMEATQYEQDKIYKQAIASAQNGTIDEFQKSIVKAQHNDNLSAQTKSTLKSLEAEIEAIKSDSNTYLNASTVLELKSKRRFTKRTLEDLKRSNINISEEIYEELNEEFEKEGLTIDDFKNNEKREFPEGQDTFETRANRLRGRLSSQAEHYLFKNIIIKEAEQAVKNYNSTIKDATSLETQAYLQSNQDYLQKIDKINRKAYKSKMTASEFKESVVPILDKQGAKGLNKKRQQEANQKVYELLLQDEKEVAQSVEALKTQKEVTPASIIADSALNTASILGKGMSSQATPFGDAVIDTPSKEDVAEEVSDAIAEKDGAKPFDTAENDELDFILPMEEPDNESMESLQEFSKVFFKEEGRVANFEDYWSEVVAANDGNKQIFDKESMEWAGNQWQFAGLGASKWIDIWNNNYISKRIVAAKSFNILQKRKNSDEESNNSEKEGIIKSEPGLGVSVITKDPINPEEFTLNTGKTTVVTPKGNYTGVRYENTEDTEDRTGKIYLGKQTEGTIPDLNTESHLGTKELLNPDKNNPGDVVGTRVSTEKDWKNTKIKVAVRNPKTGKVSKYITFSDWIIETMALPAYKGMTLDEFKTTDAFINKVPIFYTNKDGVDLMHVPDTDWYNPLNILDINEDVSEVDLYDLSPALQESIAEGKESTSTLRKQILNGDVTEGVIETKEGSPYVWIPMTDENGNNIPMKSLDEIAKDNQVVMYNGFGFVNLDNNELDGEVVILNQNFVEKDFKSNDGKNFIAYYLSPVYKENGKQYFTAIKSYRKNENGEDKAFSEDIQTAKYILGANAALNAGANKFGLTLTQAQEIREKIKKETGLDIRNLDIANNIVNGLINLAGSKSSYDAFSKTVPLVNKETGETEEKWFINALFFGNYTPIQNTGLNSKKNVGVTVTLKGGIVKVETTPTYQDFLRNRMQSNIMGYNMGTEENPQFTHSVQPTLRIKPILKESAKKTTQEVEQTQPKVEVEATEATDQDLTDIKEIRDTLKNMNSLNEFESDSDKMPPLMEDVGIIEESLETIGNLSSKHQRSVVSYISSIINEIYDPKNVGKLRETFKSIQDRFDKQYYTNLNKLKTQEVKLIEIIKKFPEDKGLSALLSNLRAAKENSQNVVDNYEEFFKKAYLESKKRGLIDSNERLDTLEDIQNALVEDYEQEMYDKDFYKNSNETVHKDKISSKLKRLFSTIYTGETGFLGTPVPADFDKVYNTVATFITSPLPPDPTFKGMIERLSLLSGSVDWAQPLIDKLKEAPVDVQNAFVSNMYKYSANAKFVSFTQTKSGVEGAVWFSNANNINQKIKDSWYNNFKRSEITKGDTLNPDRLKELATTYESWGEKPWEMEDKTPVREWLADFGIVLSDNSWKDLILGKLTTKNKNKVEGTISFKMLFADMSKLENRGKYLFSNLYKFAKINQNKDQANLNFTENKQLTPFKEMGDILKYLIPLEATHNTSMINITRRDGDKTVSEIVFPSFFLESVNKLIRGAEGKNTHLDDLLKTPFGQNSLLLDLLKNEPEMASIFNYGEVGLMSMKKRFGDSPKFSNIDQISPIDYLFHQRMMFQSMNVEKLDVQRDNFDLRVASMSTPTNSDKGRMMLIKTAVYNFFNTDLAFDQTTDRLEFKKDLKEVIYKRLVEPELDRILTSTTTNIKDYDKGAQRFNMMPLLNTIEVDGVTTLEYIKQGLAQNKDGNFKGHFKDTYFDKITDYIEDLVQNEADSNLQEVDNFAETNTLKGDDIISDIKYLESNKTMSAPVKRRAAALDYIINSHINNMNVMQSVAGDPAMYYKSKLDPLSSNKATQIQISKDLGVNLGKRLALMIAPGNSLAESKDEKYIQLFLEDNDVVAPNIEEIIAWHYGKESLGEVYNNLSYQSMITQLRNKTITPVNLKQLKLKFEKVARFLNIENTDAQEYTTLNEHLRVLKGLGRLTDAKEKEILDKVKKGESLEKEIDFLLQPLKPVYTGSIIENGVNRVMYIKSSSFPLIPELTKGTPLDALRVKMEDVETKYGKKVRASYQTANKVGAMNNPIDLNIPGSLALLDQPNDENGKQSPSYSLLLDREGFKIQQDVPFKSDKEGDDKVSMGTQIFKLLFGDGVDNIDIEGFNGKELKKEFFDTFSTMVELNKEELLTELGLDAEYKPINKETTMKSLQSLIKAEAENRNFSENDRKSLGIDSKEVNGEEIFYFKQPLWLLGNSNKVESMFNAIINNKIFKQKVPGNAVVVGSNAGITLQNQEDYKGDIVYVGDYKGEELKGTQVLAPSKIKLDGKLIDLFEKTEEGDYIYITENENGNFSINQQKIDPALFENFTFRTPTSSHGSGSNIEIVGFIPAVMGDLMITPSNFVTQMGQDFDIDKLTNYQFHHFKNPETGRIEKLNQGHIDYLLEKAQEKLEITQARVSNKENQGAFEGKKGKDIAMIDGLMLAIFGKEEYEASFSSDIEMDDKKLEKQREKVATLPNKMALKLAQNKFIEIHNKVYGNKSPLIQKRINKVLSMDKAEVQAEAIDEQSSVESNENLSLTSPDYQRKKLISGSTGGGAIGIYAKGVTFNSLNQQVNLDSKLGLIEKGVDGYGPKRVRIGDLISDGKFGSLMNKSVDGAKEVEILLARSIAESLDERVNTATDNEKAQILGRVGITHINNVAVDSLLAQLGIDLEVRLLGEVEQGSTPPTTYNPLNKFHKKAFLNGKDVYYTEYSIPYLLHSQPIIKEYFRRLKDGSSIIGNYTPKLKDKIFKEMMGNYQLKEGGTAEMTGVNLVEGLKQDVNEDLQKEVLNLYKSLMGDADSLKELNQIVDMSNLGKSMWESKDKIEAFKELIIGTSDLNGKFENIEQLLGKVNTDGVGLNMGDGIFFEPTTNQGVMVGTALSLNRNLFYDYYPYYDSYISSVIDEIVDETGRGAKTTEIQETIFQEIKKFITSNNRNGIFNGDVTEERSNLLFRKEGHKSLSTYISDILNDKGTEEGIKELKNNPFLTSLKYDVGENGNPDIIGFDNTAAGNTNEEDLNIAFKELLVSETKLPDKNGEPYTVRQLAQDLISYSHITGGVVSEAIQFHRFIPTEYYDQLMTDIKTRDGTNVNVTRLMQQYDPRIASWNTKDRLKGFKTQFYQNNPSYASRLDTDYQKKHVQFHEGGLGFTIKDSNLEYPMETIAFPVKSKSKLKKDKWNLFKNIEGTNSYVKIEVAGTFGMTEYNYGANQVTSLIKSEKVEGKAELAQTIEVYPSKDGIKEVTTDDTPMTLLEKVRDGQFPYNPALSEMADTLLTLFKDKALNITISFDENANFGGSTLGNHITLNPTADRVGEIFVHEFIHAVTVGYLTPYISYDLNSDGDISPYAPQEVKDVWNMFIATNNAIEKKYPKEYKEFYAKYRDYKAGDKAIKFTPRELSVFYPTVNIKEYLAVSLSNNQEFIEETSKMKYPGTSLTISQKFTKVMQRLFNAIAGVENNLAEQIVQSNLNFLASRASSYKKEGITQTISGKDADWAAYQEVMKDPLILNGTQLTGAELDKEINDATLDADNPNNPDFEIDPESLLPLTGNPVIANPEIIMPKNIKPCE